MKDVNLNEEEALDYLTLLSWYIHRFWKSLVRHIFPATKLIAETYPLLISTRNTTLHLSFKPVSTKFCNDHRSTIRNSTKIIDFNFTLIDDSTLFSLHTLNTLNDLEDNGRNNNQNIDNNNFTTYTTNNTIINQNCQHRQPVNSTELTKNSDPLNTTLPTLPNVNTHLPRLQRQNSVSL